MTNSLPSISRSCRSLRRPAFALLAFIFALADPGRSQTRGIELPDADLDAAYEQAASKNVLAAVNSKVFFGYWSVCADGKGFGYGNTYPSLDGHQLTDALLWLDQVAVVKANWDYVRSFQRNDGLLPLAILPSLAGKMVGPEGTQSAVSANGGLYKHWVPGNPLEATASVTYIQNADVIFRHTLDREWLSAQLPSINLAADYLDSLTTKNGAVRGGGYYLERPARLESDGVTQCYAVDALRRVAALNRAAGSETRAKKYGELAGRIRHHFVTKFWVHDHFAEYMNSRHGLISHHGLTDVDWAAIATGVATQKQQNILWARLKGETRFWYGGMPTGICTRPETYEPWEFTYPDRYDLAAMGRVWYLEAWARARMGDADGLLDGLRRVSKAGRENGYFWHERYQPAGRDSVVASGPNTYCEYPANLIRIIQEFLLGVELRIDGSILISPTVSEEFWQRGFGQTLSIRGCSLQYRMQRDTLQGFFTGGAPLLLDVNFPSGHHEASIRATVDGRRLSPQYHESYITITLPAASPAKPCPFEIERSAKEAR